MIKYSIIICTYNRFHLTLETIQSIDRAIRERKDCEIILVDNNSQDETKTLPDIFKSNNHFKYFCEENQGLSHARNRGMEESNGEILVYLDDDIEIPENYFDICDIAFSDANRSISGGKVIPFKSSIPEWLPKKYYYLVSVFDEGNQPKQIDYLMGGNFAIKADVAAKVGLYNISLGRNGNVLAGGEEIDYQNRAKQLGYFPHYFPEQKILHKIDSKLNELYVLNYAFELGKSERIVEEDFSKLKVQIKKIKSVMAIIIYYVGKGFIKQPRKAMYLRIINQFSKGYLKSLSR